uniref:BACK domain-containing protein n=1 Tax=Eutreptiella gymnastica TaxID=73025 RepID=A0A7S1IQT2_9EUGL|mmetsp:Transcript_36534/g.65366  ORF Transcript_36534/g.65366 Transcript_36534/m.65366 type:complete len:438 (+) Transcript_36534:98-1411(+)
MPADFGFDSDIYSDHKLCLKRKRKRDDDGDHAQHVGVVKVILARGSAFFKAMFESPMQDDSSQGVTCICLEDDVSNIDYKDLTTAFTYVLQCAHTDNLQDIPTLALPVMLHLCDKYLFQRVAQLCTHAIEEQVLMDRGMAMKVLSLCNCPESLACKCIDSLAVGMGLDDVYALLSLPATDEVVIQKIQSVCSHHLVKVYGKDWPEQTHERLLQLDFPAFELLLQSDDLVVRSENMVFQAIVDWIKHRPHCRKPYFDPLWKQVRKSFMTTGYLLEVVSTYPLVSERELLSITKKRLGSLYRYELGKPRCYRNPPMCLTFPRLSTGSKWCRKVYCNAVEVSINVEARDYEHTFEVVITVGGYAPVLQRELHAEVLLECGKTVGCERWIAGSSKAVIPDYERAKTIVLVLKDIELTARQDANQDVAQDILHSTSDMSENE